MELSPYWLPGCRLYLSGFGCYSELICEW